MADKDTMEPAPVIGEIIGQALDKRRLSAGVEACRERGPDFSSELEMQLAGIAMIPEAREMASDMLTAHWARQDVAALRTAAGGTLLREVIIGAGFHAAVYAATRARMGFPRPVVLEAGSAEQVGGAFAVSLRPVFRLNSRNRPGPAGLPDQDIALNALPGGIIQPAMISSEEYMTNADMAWLIRMTLAQFADVYPLARVTGIRTRSSDSLPVAELSSGPAIVAGRVIDARGAGQPKDPAEEKDARWLLTFPQFMARMGGMFPLRGLKRVAVIGGGDSARCAVESLLGVAPGHASPAGLDYVQRVDWYTGRTDGGAATCSEFRDDQRGRYVRLAQYLEGNVSNASTRLRRIPVSAYATPLPDGALVGERTYDLAIRCTGYTAPPNLNRSPLSFSDYAAVDGGTVIAQRARPYRMYRVGPVAGIGFSQGERDAGVAGIPANQLAMFRLAPRTAALAAKLPSAT